MKNKRILMACSSLLAIGVIFNLTNINKDYKVAKATTRLEAEDATKVGSETFAIVNGTGCSNGQALDLGDTGTAKITTSVAETGYYMVDVAYLSGTPGRTTTLTLSTNNMTYIQFATPDNPGWAVQGATPSISSNKLLLQAGENEIYFRSSQNDPTEPGYLNIDYIEVGDKTNDPLPPTEPLSQIRYEAENATQVGSETFSVVNGSGCSNGKALDIGDTGTAKVTVTVPYSGTFGITVAYLNGDAASYKRTKLELSTNDERYFRFKTPTRHGWADAGALPALTYGNLALVQGENEIYFKSTEPGGYLNIDYIEIGDLTPCPEYLIFESETLNYDGKEHSLLATCPDGWSVSYSADNLFVEPGTYEIVATFSNVNNEYPDFQRVATLVIIAPETKPDYTPMIIGITVGSVAGVAAIITTIFVLRYLKKKKNLLPE